MNYDTTIFRECNIRLSKDTATIDEPVYVFKGDRNIKLKFNLQGLKYKFSEHPLDIYFETQQAAFCQVKWYRADDVKITFDIQSCDGGMPVLVIKEELMDEDVELGSYSIQIRLLDYNKNSILTLPLIENAVTIKAPVFEGGETQAYIAKADEGEVGTARLSVRGVVEDTYNTDGTYNKTTWNTGDIIAANKLNKSENAIEDIVGRVNTLETTGGQQGPAGPQGEKGDKGDPGENGQTPNITIGTVTTVSSSTEASAEITGSTPNLVLNLSIPKGERGPEGTGGSGGTGADPTITIGTVTSGAIASASITGDYPDYTLNLVLPKGADGQDGTNGVDGVDGKDGLTTSIIINGVTYKESNGEITLPAYPIVPTKVSELSNDSQYVTENDITNRGYATTADIPTKLSELTDDIGHITLDDIPKATNNTAGIVKADGVTLDVDPDGTLKYIGTVADTPTLTVGTVTKGDNAAASISGTAPNYTLDLTLPKGDAGAKGDNGETVAVSVNGSTYSHINGTITLPNYPTPRTDDEIIALIQSKKLKLVADANDTTLANGKYYTNTSTTNLPVATYGILIVDIYDDGTSTWIKQTYKPLADQIFVRSKINALDWTAWDKLVVRGDMTTTINSSSTDTQIPTAMATRDYVTGKNPSSEMITECGNSVLKFPIGRWNIYSSSLARSLDDLPIQIGGNLEVFSTAYNTESPWTGTYRTRMYRYATYTKGEYIRYLYSGATPGVIEYDSGWKKVCTTTVADVGETAITTLNSYVTSGNIYYQVKNGVCYVSIVALVISTDATRNFILCSGLPKCASKPHHIVTDGSANVTSGFLGLVYLSPKGELGINLNRVGTGYCSFSYPVAEE